MDNCNDVLLVGTGYMAREYIKVLEALDIRTDVVGNSEESVGSFINDTKKEAITGGIEAYLRRSESGSIPQNAIVAVNIEKEYDVVKSLIEYGVKRVLLEKPGVLSYNKLDDLIRLSEAKGSMVYIAYNRRFFSSIERAKQIIKDDGGVKSAYFEFTEWVSLVDHGAYNDEVKKKWVLCNSSHVIDAFFYLCGYPDEIFPLSSGTISWYECGSVYCGSGKTKKGVLFSYHSNWQGPGRWGIELVTDNHRICLRPMEALHIQVLNSVEVKAVQIDNYYDTQYKPGVYEETRAFMGMSGRESDLCSLQQQKDLMRICEKVSGEEY